MATIVGGVLVGALLLYVTSSVAHRPVTTELPLIVVWATVQLAAGITLQTAGVLEGAGDIRLDRRDSHRDAGRTGLLPDLLIGSTRFPAYWIGMVPLAVDGVVAAILAAIVTLTRVP